MRETPAPAATTTRPSRQALSIVGNEIRSATTCSGIAWSADRHLGDHGERALRADEQPGEVVARRRLARRGSRCG